MKNIFLIAFMFPFYLQAQHIGPFIYWYNLKQTKKVLEKTIRNNHNSQSRDTLLTEGDTLKLIDKTGQHPQSMKMTFDHGTGYCNYQEIKISCGNCAEKSVKTIFNYFGWRKLSDGIFLSRYSHRMKMEIIRNPGSSDCTVFRFNYFYKPYSDYRKLWKSLPRP
jgi:hypothetical protein